MKPRSFLLLSLSLFGLSAAPPVAAQPHFFDPEAVWETLGDPEIRPLWNEVLGTAERHIDPADRLYLDPEEMRAVPSRRLDDAREFLPHLWRIGLAWQLTGEERFGRHGARVVTALAETIPYGHPATRGLAGRRGNLAYFYALGLEFFRDAMTGEERETVSTVLAEYCDQMTAEAVGDFGPDFSFTDEENDLGIAPDLVFRDAPEWRDVALYVPWHNFSGVTMGPVGLASITLRETFPGRAKRWEKTARWVLEQWFANGIDPQGAYIEAQAYIFYGLDRAMPFLRAIELQGETPVDLGNLPAFPDFWAMMLIPGQDYVENRNDDHFGRCDVNMLALAQMLDDPLATWLFEETGLRDKLPQEIIYRARPTPPAEPPAVAGAPRSRHFAGRGLVLGRSGWSRLDSFFGLEAGPYYHVTHSQSDKGQFGFYSLGRHWAVDSGYGRQETVDHNLILIDGTGQAPGRNVDGTSAEIIDYRAGEGYVSTTADLREAYTRTMSGKPGPAPAVALRHAVYVRERPGIPAYLLVFDHLRQDDEPHSYGYLIHTSGGFLPEITAEGALLNARDLTTSHVFTPEAKRGSAEATFAVDAPGDYQLYALVSAPSGLENSFTVERDGESGRTWQFRALPVPNWVRVPADGEDDAFAIAEAGEWRVRFHGREPGAKLYALALVPRGGDPLQAGLDQGDDGAAGRLLAADALSLTPPMQRKSTLREPRGHFFLAADGERRETAIDRNHENVRLRFDYESADPRFVAAILPALPGGPEPAFRVTPTASGGKQVTVSYGPFADRFDWNVGEPGTVTVKLNAGSE